MATDLGTLGGDFSDAVALSADGSIIVGNSTTSDGKNRAVKWTNGVTSPVDLGTLNNNTSYAKAVSADGMVIVGYAEYAPNVSHAVSWMNGALTPTDLGTLGGATSTANVVSANGRVIAGQSETSNGELHAASWTDGALSPSDLGTLGGYYSDVLTLSADGSVLAGVSNNEFGEFRAVSWRAGATTPTDLGTLGGYSSDVASISADGSIIVGSSTTTEGNSRAVYWANGATVPTDLGTLGGVSSTAMAMSADGTVVVGTSTLASGVSHAAVWKLLISSPPVTTPKPDPDPGETGPPPVTGTPTPEPGSGGTEPETPGSETGTGSQPGSPPDGQNPPPPVTEAPTPAPGSAGTEPQVPGTETGSPPPIQSVAVDVTNTAKTVAALAGDKFSVMESQRGKLGRLQRSCDVAKAGESCYSLSADIGRSGETTDALGWISMAHAFTDNFLAGITVAHSFWRDMPDSFDRDNDNIGGGFYARWRAPTTTGHWYLQGSVAASRYDVERTRQMLDYTEAGMGESTIKGWGASLEAGRLHELSSGSVFGYYAGLRHSDLKMDGYTETNAYFPFTYSDVKSRRTAVYLGANYAMPLSDKVRWLINAEIEQDIAHDDPSVTASADYIGALSFDADVAHTRGSLSTTLSYAFSEVLSVGVTPYLARTVNRDMAYGASIDVTGRF